MSKEIEVQGVGIWIDIQFTDVSPETYNVLQEKATFKDTVLTEHIIDVQDMVDDPERYGLPTDGVVWFEINALKELCKKHDAAYVRFVRL